MAVDNTPLRVEDLPLADAIDGTEIVEATQKGRSVQVLLSRLFSAGDSAYQVAVKQGYVGDVTAWLASLVGPKGDQGIQGLPGIKGDQGNQGFTGAQGFSAYQIAVSQGFVGDITTWLASLVGAKGDQGIQGIQGLQGLQGTPGTPGLQGNPGAPGASAYQVAVGQGFVGDINSWLASLQGAQGAQGVAGLSAYQVATSNGFVGSQSSWLASLQGAQGTQGVQGVPGVNGATWWTGTGAPVSGTGVSGDYYLDKSTGDYYTKVSSSAWAKQGSIAATNIYKHSFSFACSDEVTALTPGTNKITYRAPTSLTMTGLRGSLTTAQSTGALFTADVKVNGTSILVTKLTFDNASRSTKAAATPFAFSAAFIAAGYQINDDDEITVDIVQIGDGTAKGLKISLVGTDTSVAGVLGARLSDANNWTAGQTVQPVAAPGVTGVYTPDASVSNNFELTLTGNATIANPVNLKHGQVLNFTLDQDITGGHTITFGSLFKWPNGVAPAWNTAVSAKNFFSAYWDGVVLRCNGTVGYA